MNSSGIKRGLAATAVGALAVTGLPFLASSASATPLTAQATDLTLVSPSANDVDLSAKADGTNTTVRLEAIAPSTITAVTFQYSLNGGTSWTTIGTATADNGAFAYEWDPSAIAGATNVSIRATNGGTNPTATDVATGVDVNNTLETVNITDGTSVGVFQSPYGGGEDWVALTGTASDPTQAPDIDFWNGVSFTGVAQSATSTTAAGAATGTWEALVNIDGYPFGANDEILFNATETNDGTEDAEAFALYKQTITTVTAAAESTSIPAGSTTDVTVTVEDQSGNPIAGARVRNSDGSQTDTTDINGEATFTQGAGSDYYYADATNAAGYNPELGDKRSDAITVAQYNAGPSSLVASSVDGNAFDIDEYAGTDISVQVKDQAGSNFDPSDEQDLRYTWTFTPFGSTTSTTIPATGTSEVTTETNGKFTVPLPYTAPGTYVLNGSLEADAGGNNAIAASNLLTVKVGEAELDVAQGNPVQGTNGGEVPVSGTLVLEDGTPLAGRSVNVAYAAGGGGNAGIVQANGSLGADRTVTTGADGSFSATIKDPAATPQPGEPDGTLTVTTVAGTTDSDNPDATPVVRTVEWYNNLTPAQITLTPAGPSDDRPGSLTEYDINVVGDSDPNTAGVQPFDLANVEVQLTADHGYFTDGTPAPAPAVGEDAGTFEEVDSVMTDGSGDASVYLTIGRDEGFDDDGRVTATATATAGSVSDSETKVFDSSDPLNGGELEIVEAPEDRQDNPIDPTAVGGEIAYDIFVTDQFGNLVGGEDVTIDIDDPDAGWWGDDESDFDSRGDFWVYADRAGTYDVMGTWMANTYEYTVATGDGTPAFGADEAIEDTVEAEFYSVDFAASTFTMTTSPEGRVPVGTAVTETVKVVDQEGNPVQGLEVEFIRQGPGEGDGDPNVTRTTNSNGEAFYSFTGSERGTARISAVITDGEQIETLTDTVEFGGRVGINLRARGKDNGGQADKLRVLAKKSVAPGLVAKVFVKGKKVAQHKLNSNGNYTFTIDDNNGRKGTKYVVKVAKTAETYKARAVKEIR